MTKTDNKRDGKNQEDQIPQTEKIVKHLPFKNH